MTYSKGLGVAPASTIVFTLGEACTTFQADVGVDDEVSGALPTLVFTVEGDSTTLYSSGTMTPSSATQSLNLDVTGVQELRLIVSDAGDGPSEDHADWADARVICSSAPSVEFVSDRTWSSASNGWGPVEVDESLGEEYASDGGPITLNGVVYPKGLGVAPDSTVVYELNGACTTFESDIGVDDEISGSLASMVFVVEGDSTTLYTSSTMTPSSTTARISLDVTGVDTLELTVTDAGDGPGEDHGDWAGARLSCSGGSVPTSRTISYSYDGLNRLTGATESPGTTYAYSYDNAGNRTGVWVGGVQTQSLSYNAANQVIGWNYDEAGNLESDGTTTYTWDALGRMTRAGGATYAYNGDGVLVATTSGSTTTRYTQDLAAPLTQILGDGSARYIYGHERLLGVAGDGTTCYGVGGACLPNFDVGDPGEDKRFTTASM